MAKQRGQTINGAVLRMLREKLLHDSITAAASKIDVSPGVWSRWEMGGRRISDDKLALLVDLFGLSSDPAIDEPEAERQRVLRAAAPLLASTAFEAEAEAERQRIRRTVAA